MTIKPKNLNLVIDADSLEPIFDPDDSLTATKKDFILTETDYLANHYKTIGLKLAQRYDDKSWTIRMETSIFNSCLCTPRVSFWITKASVLNLHQNDINHKRPKRKSLNGDEFVRLLVQMSTKMRLVVFTRPCGRIQYMATITDQALQFNIARRAGRPIEDLIAEQETEVMNFFQGNEGEFSLYKIQPRKTRADLVKLAAIKEEKVEPAPVESLGQIQERLRRAFDPTKKHDEPAILKCFDRFENLLAFEEFVLPFVEVFESRGLSKPFERSEMKTYIREVLGSHLQNRK